MQAHHTMSYDRRRAARRHVFWSVNSRTFNADSEYLFVRIKNSRI